jgi:hypothetical protein
MGLKHAFKGSLKRAFRTKTRKLATAGIALTAAVMGAALAFAADPGATSKIDYAMTFNGSDTYAHTDSQVIPNGSDFTIEAFFKSDPAVTSNLGWIVGGGKPGDSTNSWGILAGMADQDTGSCVMISSPDGFGDCLYLNARIPSAEWVHVSLTYTASTTTYRAYINGVLMQTHMISNTTVGPGFNVGRSGKSATDVPYGQANSYFKGQIDEVKVFNSVRSIANILTDTYTYMLPSTPGLLAEYDFNEGQFGFGTIYDRTSNNFDLGINGTATFSDIAQYTNTSRTTNMVRFNRSYITAAGGWSSPAGAGTLSGTVYGAGGGGGGGAAEVAGNGGGGGGGAPGTYAPLSYGATSNQVFLVRVGVGGVGGFYGYTGSPAGNNGTVGQQSTFSSSNAAGGGGGFGGGYATGTATYTAGLGGKGGTSGSGLAGSTITNTTDGGAAGSYGAAATSNTRAGASGITDISASGRYLKPGDGGYGGGNVNAFTGANGLIATGSGGNGGGGGTTAGSVGGFGSSGTIIVTYAISSTTQDYDYLYSFNGTNQYAETPISSTALDVTGNFTMEAWVNPTNLCVTGFCTIAGRENDYLLAISNGTYWWRIANSNSSSAWYNTGVAFTTGQWQHVALVRSGTSVLLYANGQLMSTQTSGDNDASGTPISLTSTTVPGPGWFEVAAHGIDHIDMFTGGIDEVRVWNTVRTATEIGDGNTGDFNRPLNSTELGSAGLLAYWDMNDLAATRMFMNRKTGATSASDLGWSSLLTSEQNNRSVQINNRYLTIASVNSTSAYGVDSPSFELAGSNFTISGWWQIPSCATTNYLVTKANTYAIATDSACKINVQLDPGNEGDGQTWQWMNSGYVMSTATWHYVSVIKTGQTLKLYVDGALATTVNDGDSVQTFNSAGTVSAVVPANLGDRNTYFGVGSTGVGTTRSNVSSEFIDDIRLWNTDRSSKQNLDMAGFVPHTQTGLQAMFDFNTLQAAALAVPNMASTGASDSNLIVASALTSGVSSATSPPSGQPVRLQQFMQRSLIRSSTIVGGIPTGATSAEYWVAGGGGGGGSGGNSGLTGAGGGAGGLQEGTVTNLVNSIAAEPVTTLKVGVGGRYAINNGDSVLGVAGNGTSSSFLSTGVSVTAIGGGAGGSGTANLSTAPQGLDGGSGGGSGQTGGAGGSASQGYAGGAGSSAASGGGGGARSAGGNASSGAGGAGGKGLLLPLANSAYSQYPTWVGGGGSGYGTGSSSTTNSAFGATTANADAAAYSGSGGGGAGFASSSAGTSRGGYGANGFVLINYALASPYVDSGPTSLQSGQAASTPISVSLRDINGDVLTTQSGVGTIAADAGCTLLGTYSISFTAGRASVPGFAAYSTSATTCRVKVSFTSVTPNSTAYFSVPIKTSPASITVNTSATSGVCSFTAGVFNCPDNTAAILNVNDLNAQLNSNDVTLVTRGGDITINSTVTGSTGALNLVAYGAVKMNSGITLNGLNKSLKVQSLNQIVGNESATQGAPTAFTTNGGAIYLYTGTGSNTSAGYVKLSTYNTFTTKGGAFVVSGGTDPTTGYATGNSAAITSDITANGIYMATGASVSTDAGDVTMRGQLWGSRVQYNTPGMNSAGISLYGTISTSSGAINLVGIVPNLLYDQNYRNGITLSSATISSDSGNISISGDSTADSSNIYTSGIYVSGCSITSNSGNVTTSGNTPLNAASIINFVTPQSTFGSQTGDVTLTAPATLTRVETLNFLKLTGAGTHSLLFNYPLFTTPSTSLQAWGTGDLVVSPIGARAFASGITIPASFDVGTGYRTITMGDNPTTASTSQTLSVNTPLVASDYVSLKGFGVNGNGSVTSPKLAIVARSTVATNSATLTGSSDVDTLAITHSGAAQTSGTLIGITDADGWTPGTVAGVDGVYGVAKNIAYVTAPSTTSTKNQVLPAQPVVKLTDAYGYTLTASNLTSSNYTVTPSISSGTPNTALSPTTPVAFASGQATLSGLKFNANTLFGLTLTVSPALSGTNTVSSSVTVSAYAAPTSITVSPASLNATSGAFFASMPTATYWDPYGNPSGTANGAYAPTVALTSGPAGGVLTSGSFGAANNVGLSTGSNFKLTGPSGTYVLSVTGAYAGTTSSTQTITVNLLGWSVSYGASSLNYTTTPYSPTFSGNGTGAVTYSTSTGTICTVNSTTGDMTPVTAGTCTITANQATDGTYSPGSATVSVTIVAAPQPSVTVSASPTDLSYLGSTTLTGGGGAGTGAYSYTKTAGNCTLVGAVLSYGTAHAGDTCSVTSTRALTTGKYTATTSTVLVINVVKAAQASAVVVPTGRTVGYSNTVDLASFTYSGGNGTGAFVFSTSTTNCSITGTVLTSFATVGTNCVVSVRRDTSADYLISSPVTMNVQTNKGTQSVSFVTVASTVRVADSVTLSATASSGLAVAYSLASGSSSYCSISGAVVTFTAPGTCVVQADQAGDANVNAATTQTLTYSVSKALQTITFAAIADDMVRTTTMALAATSSSNLTVTYSVGAATTDSACSVTSTGTVSLSAVGTCEIKASQAGNSNYEAAADVSQSFTVGKGIQAALVITSASHAAYQSTIALTATGGNGTGLVTWVVNSGPCSIPASTTTLVLGDAGTTCVVMVEKAGDANWQNSGGERQTITVDKAAQTALTITNPNNVVYGNQLALTYGGGSGSGAITWTATAPCSVSGTNLTVGNAGVGCVVTLSKDGDDNYLPASATLSISVTRAQQAPVVIDSADHVAYLQTITLSASGGSGSGLISYSTTGTCSITGTNLLHVGVVGSTCTVTATRAQSTNFDAQSSAAMTLTVDKADQVIGAINVSGMARALGSAPISASSDSGLIVTLTVDSSSASVCSITATILSFATAGDCLINANQAGDTNHNAAVQVQRTLTVYHAGQTINLVNPGPKRYLDSAFSVTASTISSLPITFSLGAATSNAGQNDAACSVTSGGLVTIGELGTCEILADQNGDGVYDPAAQASVVFSVGKAIQPVLSLSSASGYVYGGSLRLTATGGDGTGAVTFATGPGQDCSIDQNTVLSGGDAGSACTVRVSKAADAHFEASQSGLEQIDIAQAWQTVTVSSTASNPTVFGTYTVVASADSGEPVTVVIDQFSQDVCSVTGYVVSFLKIGTCQLEVQQAGTTNYVTAAPVRQLFYVNGAAQNISAVTPTNVSYGDARFQFQASSDSGLAVSYLSYGACYVSSTGQVTIYYAGHCDVEVYQSGDDYYAYAGPINFGFDIAKGNQEPLTFDNDSSVDYGGFLILGTSGGSGAGQVSYATVGTCTVFGSLLTPGDAGSQCEVQATKAGDQDHEAVTSEWLTVTVNKVHQAQFYMASSNVVTYGNTITLDAADGLGDGAITYQTTGTCSEANGILTVGDAGSSCKVSATKAESTNYLAGSTAQQTITVLMAQQSISITSSPSQPVALGTYTITASANSGLNVTFAVNPSSTNVCSVNGSLVTFLASGSCVIEASQNGDTNFNPAPTSMQTITVAKASQTITFSNAGVKHFGDADFAAQATSDSGLTLTFDLGAGTTNSACSVASDGTVTILDVGICEVTADQSGDDTYAVAARATLQININKGSQATLTISSANQVVYSQTLTLAATGGSGSGALAYQASGDCTESNGVLTVGVVGSHCEVRATKSADSQYESATSVWQPITVTKANQSALTITSASSVAYGGTITLAATGGSGPTSLTYATTGTCAVTSGVLAVGDAGSPCTVTAINAASSNYLVASSQPQTVTVTKAANAVHFTSAAVSPTALGNYRVKASADSGDQVSFAINANSNTVCFISGSTVSFLTSGDCVIDASEDGNDNFNAATNVQQTVAVAHASQTITFTAAGTKRFGGAAFSAAATSTSGLTITYSRGAGTTNTACSVASDGTVNILDVGNCQITANQAGNIVYSAANAVNQDVTIGKGTQSTLAMSSANSVAYGDTLTLTAVGGSGAGTVSFATTGACTISNGILTVGVVGSTCSVTATKSGDSQYDPISSNAQSITVLRGTQAQLTINLASSQTFGATQTLSTSGGSGGGAVSYSTGAGCVVSGSVLSVGGGGTTCHVTAHKAASANFNSIDSADFTVNVEKADQTITRTGSAVYPYAHDFYTPFVTASSNLSVAVSIDSSSSSVCSYGHGGVYFDTAGSCVINYDQAGDSNYNSAPQVQETVTVAKLSQTISVTNPSYRHYGDAAFQIVSSSDSGLPVTYNQDANTTNNSCTVSSTGFVTILAPGICAWIETQAGDATYLATSTGVNWFSIDRAQQASTTLVLSATSVAAGGTITLSVTGGSGTGSIRYVVSGTCTVSGSTLTVGNAGSSCSVYGIKEFDDYYAAEATAQETITVIRATQVTLTIDSVDSVVYGHTITLSTIGGSGSGAVTYATTGTCSVSNGVLTVGHAGSSCAVTATKAQSTNFNAVSSAPQNITITRESQTISISSSPTSPTALDTYVVHATATSGLSVDVTVDNSSSSICSISGSNVTFLTSGSCVINANQLGDTNFTAAAQVQQTITVAKKAQASHLTIPATTGNRQIGEVAFLVSGSADSGLAVAYSVGGSTTNNSCSVNSSTGLVTILDVGVCYITVNQAGDDTWAVASSTSGSFTIGKAEQAAFSISSSTTVTYGNVINLNFTGGSGNGAVTYTTTGTCYVVSTTLFVGDAGSSCAVTAHKEGNGQYLPIDSATQTITIQRANQAPLGLSNTYSVPYGQLFRLTTAGGSGDGAVSYAVTGACSVAGDILTLGDASSICNVVATKAQSLNYNAISDVSRVINVTQIAQTISITSSPTAPTALGSYTFVASATSSASVTATIDASSSSVCSVLNNVVTYLTSGSCVINANQAGTTNYTAAVQVQQTITVAKKAQAITFPAITAKQFGVADFAAGASAGSALAISYSLGSSTTNNACSVTSSGTVSILAAGECYLVADQAGDDIWAAAAQVTIHFNALRGNQASISMTSASSVTFGNTLSLASVGGSGSGAVTYVSGGTCSVSGTTLTIGDAGSLCTVRANKDLDSQYLAQMSPVQTITVNRASQSTLDLSSISGLKHGQTITLSTTGGSGTGAVTYTATGSCTISGAVLTGGSAGSNCSVYATKAQSTNYLAADSATSIELVAKSAQTISLTSTPSNATALGSYTVVATASSGLPVTVGIATGATSNCSVVGMLVTFANGSGCVLEISQAGDSNFETAPIVTQTISVQLATDTITIPSMASRTVFSTDLTASATSISGLPLTYASIAPSNGIFNCTVTTSGVLTLVQPGTCWIRASHASGTVYAAATALNSFTITRAEQSALTVTSASSVAYLGSVQLSAAGGSGAGAISFTANGACVITSGTLTVADVGSSCSVTATRAGDTNYNAVTSATQTITVTQINQDAIIVVSAAHVRYGQTLPLVSAGGTGSGAESWSIDTTANANTAGCSINSGTLDLGATTSGACDIVVTKAASRNYHSAVSPRFNVTVNKAYQSINFTSNVPTQPVSGDSYSVAASSTSSLAVTYSVASASTAFCSIAGAVVTFAATGDCVIEANQVGDGCYLAAPTTSQTIAVDSLNQVITASNVRNHTFGDPAFVVVGETTSSSPVTFALGANTTSNACSVSSSGVVNILAVGHCEIVLSAAADAQYAAASDITRAFEVLADQASAPFITSASADNQSVTLSYLAPSYIGGSAIRAYGINAYLNGVLAAAYSGCAANQTSCTINGLTNGLAYTFRMIAVNAAGDGVESSATGAITPATHAEAVRQLVAVGVNTALDISWLAPASLGGGTFDSYRIYVRARGGAYPSTPTEVVYDDNQTATQLTGLVNGNSYDVKVVTITTANTVQLVSNTAEVLQYPKTIPDAPQTVNLAPVGASTLLVSWTAPISDGGDAISNYAAQVVGGAQCSVSSTSNSCEVSGLVEGASYRVAVVATNGAGSSIATEAQITFRAASVAGANQGNVSNPGGGSGSTSNPTGGYDGVTGGQVHGDVWISLDKRATALANGQADGVTISGKIGGKAIFKGKGLGLIYSAYIGNHLPVKILSSSDERVMVQLPASKVGGWQDMWFFTDSHAIRYVDVVRYGLVTVKVAKVISGFSAAPKVLTQAQKSQLWKAFRAVGKYASVDCKGSSAAAILSCKYLKTARPWTTVHITRVKIQASSPAASKQVKLTFTK